MTKFDPQGFVRKIMQLSAEGLDIDGSDFQDAAIKHGLIEERPLTAEQIVDDKGPWHEYGCDEGDLWNFWTEALKKWLGDPT